MATTVTLKRGTTFACTCTYVPSEGAPSDLLDTTITSDIIDANNATYHLDVTMAGDGMSFVLNFPGDTARWNLGVGSWDLKFTTGGVVFYSRTLRIVVIDQITL